MGGRLLVSAAPAAGAGAWSARTLPLQSITCPSAQLCVAADGTGQVLSATDPANGPWPAATLGGPPRCYKALCVYDAIISLSCPSSSFCAATDGSNLWTSTDPTAGPAAWLKSSLPAPGAQIACPSATLCIAASGRALTITSDPGDPTPTWVPTGPTDPPPDIRYSGLACATIHACVAVDGNDGYAVSGDPTGAGPTWTVSQIAAPAGAFLPGSPVSALTAVTCEPMGLCLATDGTGHAIAGQWTR
jgi:hypothetical protein